MDNRSFWNDRYATLPQLGSGPGSRGYAASHKNELVRRTLQEHRIKSILDIGCGDLCWLDPDITQACSYVGCDISDTIIARNKAVYAGVSSASFVLHDIAARPLAAAADLVICFDVLIHQVDRAIFDDALRNIIAEIGSIGFISYLSPPKRDDPEPAEADIPSHLQIVEREFATMSAGLPKDFPRGETAFHGALPDLIRSFRDDLRVEPIEHYRRQTIYRIAPTKALI